MRKFTLELYAAKISIITKNALNESCLELNFLQKSQWVHMYVSPKSGNKGLQRILFFKRSKMRKFTFRLKAAKSTD